MARRAIVQVNFGAISSILFAQGTEIRHARPSFSDYSGDAIIEFVVENESLPDVEQGLMLPYAEVIYHTDADGRIHMSFKPPEPKDG